MSLLSVLDARRADAGSVYLDLIAEAASHLGRAGLPGRVRGLGERAPDFALPNPDGELLALSGLLRSGPVVLSFFRGEWCMFCEAEIAALLEAQPQMAQLGATLVMVSPEQPSRQLISAAAERRGRVHVLRDPMLGVALQYGLVFQVPAGLQRFYCAHNPDLAQDLRRGAWLLPLPADFVIASDGLISLSYADPDFTRRLDPFLIVELLRSLRRRR